MVSLIYVDTVRYDAGRPQALFLLADEEKLRSSKIAIFGIGQEAYLISNYLENRKISVDCFLNNDCRMSEKIFCKKKITTLDQLDKEEYLVIVSMTKPKYNNEVLWQLKVNGYEEFGVAFIEYYHAFSGKLFLDGLQATVIKEINKILCSGKDISQIISPVINVGPSANLLGMIPELCWTTTWSNCLMEWFYETYQGSTQNYKMLEIGPGRGVFSAVAHQIANEHMNIQWLMFDMDDKSETAIKGKYTGYPADQFETYYGMIEDPDFHIVDQFDIIIMTEVLEHFVTNPVSVLKKIGKMLKTDGRLYISTPDWGPLNIYKNYRDIPEYTTLKRYRDNYIGHTFQYSRQELESLLAESGFIIERYALSDSNNHNLIAKHQENQKKRE